MPKKRTDGFQKLTIEAQQGVIDRFKTRVDVRDANAKLVALLLSWLKIPIADKEAERAFLKKFQAAGHEGEYHEEPSKTTFDRAMPQINQLPNITKRLNDTPLDYMGALELSYVYQRIQGMIDLLQDLPKGTTADALVLYRQIGESIREKVYNETGHYPEEFPVPDGILTGDEEPTQFKLRDHQPPLM